MKLLLLFMLYYMQCIGSWTKGDSDKYGFFNHLKRLLKLKCEYFGGIYFKQKTCYD